MNLRRQHVDNVQQTLIAGVNAAFGGTSYPEGDPISEYPQNDEGTAEYFGGRSWRDCVGPMLAYHHFALLAFTPKAFAYFLPAFLMTGLTSPEYAPLDSLIYALTPPKNDPHRPSYWRRWVLLSSAQRRVVVACLRFWDPGRLWGLESAAAALEATIDE
jgi:hypothetical protein